MSKNRYNNREISNKLGQAQRLKELEAENTRLKDKVVILTLDKLILEEIAEEQHQGCVRK
jgi:hypothetical protein